MVSEVTKSNLTKLVKYLTYSYLPFGIVIAVLTPDNILEYAFARNLTEFMAIWLPFVEEVGRWTKVPATQFIGAVMNVIAIIWSVSAICTQNIEENIKWLSEMSTKKKAYLLFFGIPFLIGCALVVLFLVPVNPRYRRDVTIIGSSIGMGFTGSIMIAGAWFALTCVVNLTTTVIVILKRRYFGKQQSR